jgi:DNA-binding transcriptional ArsR family regulator
MERERRAGAKSSQTEPGPDADALSLSQVEAVLRRAAQLDAQSRSPVASGLSAEEVTRIALDAGLSPAAVDAAVRELQVGGLSQEQKQALLDKYIGPDVVRTARVVDLSPDAAAAALRRLFEEELLEPLEKQGRRTIWGPQEGLRANVLRTVRHGWTGKRTLRKLELISDVRPADATGQRSIISIEARLEGRGSMIAGPLVLATVSTLATIGLAGTGLSHLLAHVPDATQFLVGSGAALAAGSGLSAVAASGTARTWRKRLRQVRVSLDELLELI